MQPTLPFDQALEPAAAAVDRGLPDAGEARTSRPSADTGELARVFQRLYRGWNQGSVPQVQIEFYHYSSLRHTLRIRDGILLARLSDVLRQAPADVQEALMAILICKLLRKRLPARYQRRYQEWSKRPDVRERAREIRAQRGSKQLTSPQGRVFDLALLYRRLNRRYFEDQLEIQHVSWSRKKARTRLGHYDPAHRTIVVNRRLDNPLVPEFVVSFIVYHEMLHAALGEQCLNGRRHFHHAEFRKAERRFHDYERAQRFIENELP